MEEVAPDEREAHDLLRQAEAHLESAVTIAASDPTGAYQLAYDAARKAIAADMAANGYRAKGDRPGAHAAVVAYAEEALAGEAEAASLSRLDGMRRLRKRAEYGGMAIGAGQLAADLEHAREVVRAVGSRLPRS